MTKSLLLLLLCGNLFAETFKSRVVRISDNLVFWENGRVTKVDDKILLQELEQTVESRLRIIESSDGNIGIQSFEPTVLESENGARSFYQNARRPSPWQWSWQCTNIAHVRAFEEFKRTGLKSMKIFLFFSDRYIREYNFKWWFHVTPMTFVRAEHGISERIIDKEWTKGPLTYKQWTDLFMKNKAECKKINFYSDYEKHQEEEFCYLLPASMFYWQPKNLEEFERTRKERSEFDMDEVRWAYKQDM
jgi:hypothetical protein